MAHFSYLDNKMKNTSISSFQSIFTIHKPLVFATLCVPLVGWWGRQWGWITRPFHGSPTIGSDQTSDQLLHMPHNCHFFWPTYTNLILPHICHFYDDEIISWEPPYWIRPNIWPSSTHASYLSLFRWGQNKERLFQCIGCSPQRLTNIFIGLWHTYKSKTSGQSIYRFHQNLSSFVF